ncbi:anti-sigma factor antagonist [Nesterenkonia sp. AN1]|uniref:Anti-sigma factor antagonist n=1 Tax=Nesterenkonia aurantiaca TaxID=1436010 RepID=A0A4V3EC32_9MICC|nr:MULTISPECIES: STAS domain-containing protein [Nesterenkonia]EXF24981.1 anti-sigma factor antagonist [Nesterenkonia sp. AN1]TDS84762.1 anti-sigma B factor antagonist [Nesterenkonia aurantiaca]
MNLNVTTHARYAVVRPEGRLTASAAPRLKQAMRKLIEEGNPRIVVDLGQTDFIDSSGLGALIGGLKAARLAEGDLRLAAASESVQSVLKLTSLDRVLRDHPTVEAAFGDE